LILAPWGTTNRYKVFWVVDPSRGGVQKPGFSG